MPLLLLESQILLERRFLVRVMVGVWVCCYGFSVWVSVFDTVTLSVGFVLGLLLSVGFVLGLLLSVGFVSGLLLSVGFVLGLL